MVYESQKASSRLRKLRQRGKMSQREMAIRLSEKIPGRTFDTDNGKNTISQLETDARGITIDYAFAYADIFDVSLDYIYGYSDDWQPENKSIKEITGLSDEEVRSLRLLRELKAAKYNTDDLDYYINEQAYRIASEEDVEQRAVLLKELLEYQAKHFEDYGKEELKKVVWGEMALCGIKHLLTTDDGLLALQFLGRLYSPDSDEEVKLLAFGRIIDLLSKIRHSQGGFSNGE